MKIYISYVLFIFAVLILFNFLRIEVTNNYDSPDLLAIIVTILIVFPLVWADYDLAH